MNTIERADTANQPALADLESLRQLDAAALLAELPQRLDATRIALACSFQKEESVLLSLLAESGALAAGVRVFALDTGVLFPETYELWRAYEQRFEITIEAHRGISLEEQARTHGDELWARDPVACCGLRKLIPLKQALSGLDAWITGVRREQSPTRASAQTLDWDEPHGLWKANPLAAWSDRDVWRTISSKDLPYNPLHDQGYGSIGCTHCTQPGDGRDGRWAGQDKTECGLHADG